MKTLIPVILQCLTTVLIFAENVREHHVHIAENSFFIEQNILAEEQVIEITFSQANGKVIWNSLLPISISGQIITNGCVEVSSPCTISVNERSQIQSQGITLLSEEKIFNRGRLHSQGGPVKIISPKIELCKATIDASSQSCGGDILIGGDWYGTQHSFPNSKVVTIDAATSIITNALDNGFAGDVVIWSDEATFFHGTICANGAAGGGNVEVSSKNFLLFDGFADTTSSMGNHGTLLIDPATITVQSSNPDIQGNGTDQDITSANQLANPATYPGANSIITAAAVDSLLTGGVSMTLSATSSITINSPITASGVVNTLTLNAPTVNLNEPITLPSGGSISGSASIVNVGPSGNIQNGVDAVAAGGTVTLASATYIQEVYISKNLTLNGSGVGNTVIQCPTTPTPLTNTFVYTINGATYHPMILAEGASNIIIQNMTVNGNSQPTNFLSYRFVGIGYHNAGGTIQNTYVTNIEDSYPAGATQHGFGIFGAIDTGTYTIQVLNNVVDHFQKQGITMRGPTLTTTISGNTVTGETPPSAATMNGIVIQNGATATILNNTVSNILSATPGVDSVSIFLIDAGTDSTVSNNSVNNGNIGVYSLTAGNNLSIMSNVITLLTTIGIYVQDTDGLTTISSNQISCNSSASNGLGITVDNPDTGTPIGRVFVGSTPTYNVYLLSSANIPFQFSSNTFNPCNIGLAAEGSFTAGPQVSMNHDVFVGEPTYFIQLINNPNNTWPSTSTVSFNGLVSGYITYEQYLDIQSHLSGNLQDPSLGVILEYLQPFQPQPPSNFIGRLKKDDFLNKTQYCLRATWTDSTSPNVVAYNIYYKGNLREQSPAGLENIYRTVISKRKDANYFTITSLNDFNLESTPVTLKVVNE